MEEAAGGVRCEVLSKEPAQYVGRISKEIGAIPELERGFSQVHHLGSTVSDHSFHVAIICASVGAKVEKLSSSFSTRELVRAALLHDLGVVGNRGKSLKELGGRPLAFYHPSESVRIASARVTLTEKETKAIESHMWPLSTCAPCSAEAVVLCIVDKAAAVSEIFGYEAPPCATGGEGVEGRPGP